MPFKPLFNLVVIKPDDTSKTKGGILIDTTQNQIKEGTVVSVGPGEVIQDGSFSPTTVQPGQRVLYDSRAGGTEITVDFAKNVIMSERSILGILNYDDTTF